MDENDDDDRACTGTGTGTAHRLLCSAQVQAGSGGRSTRGQDGAGSEPLNEESSCCEVSWDAAGGWGGGEKGEGREVVESGVKKAWYGFGGLFLVFHGSVCVLCLKMRAIPARATLEGDDAMMKARR